MHVGAVQVPEGHLLPDEALFHDHVDPPRHVLLLLLLPAERAEAANVLVVIQILFQAPRLLGLLDAHGNVPEMPHAGHQVQVPIGNVELAIYVPAARQEPGHKGGEEVDFSVKKFFSSASLAAETKCLCYQVVCQS